MLDGNIPVNEQGRVTFCSSKSNVLWPILLEKAYAKVFGAYWNIGGAGAPSRALKDLTGAPTEFLKFKDYNADELFDKIIEADKHDYIMVSPTKSSDTEVEKDKGLIPFHAYTVISALSINGEKVIKLRNPHGKGEWTGDWSDKSTKWTNELKKQFKVLDVVDGTFYIPLSNFKKNFIEVAICHYKKENILSQRRMEPEDMKGVKGWKIFIGTKGKYYISMGQPDKRYEAV